MFIAEEVLRPGNICFSMKLHWKGIMKCCLIDDLETGWSRLVDWGVVSLQGKSLKSAVSKIAGGAVVYYIWCQRNSIIHGGQQNTESEHSAFN